MLYKHERLNLAEIEYHVVLCVLDLGPSDSGPVCEPGVSGAGVHHHAGVRVESTQPLRPHELLRAAQLPGALPTLGPPGLLTPPGELCSSRHDG